MSKLSPRRLTLADLVILIVGAGLSLGIIRMSLDTSAISFETTLSLIPGYRIRLVIMALSLGIAVSLIASRALQPRPRRRAIFRQPGTVACLAILGHMGMVVLMDSWHELLANPNNGSIPSRVNFNTYLYGNHACGAWVVVTWATLALAQIWRPEPSWIDRTGRFLGVVAILLWLWSTVI